MNMRLKLDLIASILETKGMTHQASLLDQVSNTLDESALWGSMLKLAGDEEKIEQYLEDNQPNSMRQSFLQKMRSYKDLAKKAGKQVKNEGGLQLYIEKNRGSLQSKIQPKTKEMLSILEKLGKYTTRSILSLLQQHDPKEMLDAVLDMLETIAQPSTARTAYAQTPGDHFIPQSWHIGNTFLSALDKEELPESIKIFSTLIPQYIEPLFEKETTNKEYKILQDYVRALSSLRTKIRHYREDIAKQAFEELREAPSIEYVQSTTSELSRALDTAEMILRSTHSESGKWDEALKILGRMVGVAERSAEKYIQYLPEEVKTSSGITDKIYKASIAFMIATLIAGFLFTAGGITKGFIDLLEIFFIT